MITLHDLLAQYESEKQVKRGEAHTGLTASASSALCRKRDAYTLHRVEPSDTPDPVSVATVGSMIHVGVGELWFEGSVATEVTTEHGTADVYDPAGETTGGTPAIRDLKTLGRSKFDRWLAPPPPDDVTGEVFTAPTGPDDDVWKQLGIYAMSLYDDRPVVGSVLLVIDALCRESGRTHTYTRLADQDYCRNAVDALQAVEDRLLAVDPDEMEPPRDGPDDWFCQGCPFATRCWGERDTIEPVEDVELLLEGYFYAGKVESAAKKTAADAKARKKAIARQLADVEKGTHGRWALSWRRWSIPERHQQAMSGVYPSVSPVSAEER